jgi:hypothetical protein
MVSPLALARTAEGEIVLDTDPQAAFLVCGENCQVPDAYEPKVKKFLQGLKRKAEAPAAPVTPVTPPTPPAPKKFEDYTKAELAAILAERNVEVPDRANLETHRELVMESGGLPESPVSAPVAPTGGTDSGDETE